MKILEFHEKRGIPYRAVIQNESISLTSELHDVRNKSEFPPHELWFIAAVKDNIIKHNLSKGLKNYFPRDEEGKLIGEKPRKIKYFYFNKNINPGTVIENCYEVDMKSAYFEMAYKLGLITEKLYTRCVNPPPPLAPISKPTRLAAIGSVARKRYVIDFDGTKQIAHPAQRQTETEYLWDTICYRVGKIMARIAKKAGSDFVFFWVDALFIKGDSLALVQKLFEKEGFACSIDPVKSISFSDKSIKVDGKKKRVKNKQTGKWEWKSIRPFPFKQSLTEKEILELASQGNE